MKKIFFLILFCSLSMTAYAQDILDNHAQYRIKYDFYFKGDSIITDYKSDNFYLDICKNQSFFYSRTKFYRDSVKLAMFAKTADVGTTMDAIRHLERGAEWYTIKEFTNDRMSLLFHSSYIVFRNDEKITIPQWKLLPDTLTVLGYLCNKATTYFRGRTWNAWYTQSLPMNDGPWLLWGLPGTILYAKDSNGYFIFEGLQVKKLNPPYGVVLPHESNRLKKVNSLEYRKIEESYLSNDMLFVNQMSGVLKEEVYNTDGTPVKPLKRKFITLTKY